MRDIVTRETREGKERRNKTIIGIILVGIMVLSTAGYALYQTGREEETRQMIYEDTEFSLQNDGLWHFDVRGYEFATLYNPEQTENISGIIYTDLDDYTGETLYFSHDSEQEGINEIGRSFFGLVERIQKVCLEECEEDLPVKNCTDKIIIIRTVGENLIRQEDNCIYILSDEGEVLRTSDAFVFKILGLN